MPTELNSIPKMSVEKNNDDFDALIKAIKQCLIENKAIRSTARQFNIAHSTLSRHVKKVTTEFVDISTIDDDVLMDFVREKQLKIPANMVNSKLIFGFHFFFQLFLKKLFISGFFTCAGDQTGDIHFEMFGSK